MNDDGCLISTGFSQDIEQTVGKFVIAPTDHAKMMWDLVRKDPTNYSLAFAWIEDTATGKKDLIEISLVPRVREHE